MTARSEGDTTADVLRKQVGFYESNALSYDRWLASLADESNTTDHAPNSPPKSPTSSMS